MDDSAVVLKEPYRSHTTAQTRDERAVGEILRKIVTKLHRKCDRQLEESLVKSLGKTDQRNYWDLVNKHPDIRDALGDLRDIQCLWPDMILSTIHKAFAMKCDEVR